MAYQINRHKKIQEELELMGEHGEVLNTFHVALDADTVVKKLCEKQAALVRAQQNIQSAKENLSSENMGVLLETLQNSIVDLFGAVFEKEDMDKLLNAYEGKYIQMCQEILPFITDVILPKVRDNVQKTQKELIQKYTKKQKKKSGFRI